MQWQQQSTDEDNAGTRHIGCDGCQHGFATMRSMVYQRHFGSGSGSMDPQEASNGGCRRLQCQHLTSGPSEQWGGIENQLWH